MSLKSRRQGWRTIPLLAAALALTAASCGGDDEGSGESAASETATEDATTTTAPSDTTATTETTTVDSSTTESTDAPPTTPVPQDTLPGDSCDPYPLVKGTGKLNDRCDVEWLDVVSSGDSGVWTFGALCPRTVAVANELLLTVDAEEDLQPAMTAVEALLDELGFDASDAERRTARAGVIKLNAADGPAGVVDNLARLQGVGRSVDFNYLEPMQPNNGFRPADDPAVYDPDADENQEVLGDPPSPLGGEAANVLVIDSPPGGADYEGNGLLDEDHGHGDFVTSIIVRESGSEGVRLEGIEPPSASARWAPMLFSDFDIIKVLEIKVLESESPEFNALNLSLGGVGCFSSDAEAGVGIGERLSLARYLRAWADAGVAIVAAAGNDGDEVPHFPAAWRSTDAMVNMASAVAGLSSSDLVPPGSDPADVAEDITQLHAAFADAVGFFAVGSVDTGFEMPTNGADATSWFSNCGDWINAAAYGNQRQGSYAGNSEVIWSGTSFATANFTAAWVSGRVDPSGGIDATTGARLTGGLACP